LPAALNAVEGLRHWSVILLQLCSGKRVNKTENAFSPLPARTKASNADMTACLPLQACMSRLQVYRPEISAAALHACILGAARLQWQVLKLHVCACRCPDCCSQTAVTVMQWQDTKLHARMRTATLLQWQDNKLHASACVQQRACISTCVNAVWYPATAEQ
jgi:hypothetical protein